MSEALVEGNDRMNDVFQFCAAVKMSIVAYSSQTLCSQSHRDRCAISIIQRRRDSMV